MTTSVMLYRYFSWTLSSSLELLVNGHFPHLLLYNDYYYVREGNLDLSSSLELLVIDEADLIFSFGFEADLRFILTKLPTIFQVLLILALTT